PTRVQVLEVFPAHEPGRLRVADPRSGPRLCEAQWFMAPMRVQQLEVRAAHERAFPVRRPCRQNAEWSGLCRFISVKVSRRETKRRVQGGRSCCRRPWL